VFLRHRAPRAPFALLVLVLALLVPGLARAQTSREEKVIDIDKGARARIPIVIEDFSRGAGAAAADVQSVQKVVAADLDYADAFTITAVRQVAANDPALALAQAVVRGTVAVAGGELVLSGVLESARDRSRIFSRDYRTRPDGYREAAHRFSDDIVLYLTGQPGIARTKIAFVSDRTGTKEVYVVDYDGHGLRQVTKNKSINMSPAWSPDGRKLAYVSFRKGDPDVWAIDLYGGQDRLVAGGPGVQSSPAYSPDGGWIAYSQTAGRESEIHLVAAAGGKPRRVTRVGGINTAPSWAPDGRRLVFTSDRAGNPQLYMAEVEGGTPRRITFDGKWNDLPDWSPDGKRIVFASQQEGGYRIRMVDPSGLAEERPLTFGPGSDEHPSWAPDGRHVVFASSRGGKPGIWVLDVDGGRLRAVVEGAGRLHGPTWSPVPPR
jgi:TolB protein